MRKLWLLLLAVSLPVWTAPALAERQEMVRYIGLDFNGKAGTLYNDQFEAFPPSGEDFTGRTVWILGLRVQVVRLAPDGTVEDKTEEDQYTRVLHRSVLAYT